MIALAKLLRIKSQNQEENALNRIGKTPFF